MGSQNTMIHHNYFAGDAIIIEGDSGNDAYVIIKGKVCITKKVNQKALTLATLK
jgi:hypothetical protein